MATNIKDDKSRKGLPIPVDQACLAADEPNLGLCTHLNLALNVKTEEEKLNALDKLIRNSRDKLQNLDDLSNLDELDDLISKSHELKALGLVEQDLQV